MAFKLNFTPRSKRPGGSKYLLKRRQQAEDYMRGIKAFEANPLTSSLEQMDVAGTEAQKQALQQLSGLTRTGLTAEDLASLEQIRRGVAQQERGQRQALLQQAQSRGQAGGQALLGSQLAAQQGAAERGYMGGMEQASQAQAGRRAAISGLGQLGTQFRGQEQQRAQMLDAIAQFNEQQRLAQFQSEMAKAQADLSAAQQAEAMRRAQIEAAAGRTGSMLQGVGQIMGSFTGGGK